MKPLSRTQTIAALLTILGAFCFVSNDDYNHVFVEPIISASTEQALVQPRVEMVALKGNENE